MRNHAMPTVLTKLFLTFSLTVSCATANDPAADPGSGFFDFYLPWDDASETAVSLRFLNASPAGAGGFVTATPDGHLRTRDGRIRFWGVNVCFGANFPRKEDAPRIAARMAKFGINLVRFHHMDNQAAPNGIWKSVHPDREIDPDRLDRLDFFIAALKKNGIYADLNLLVSRPFRGGGALPADIDAVDDWKLRATIGMFDPTLIALQQTYARDLLAHVNPYTGARYADEPAVAFVEINNENGLAHSFLSGNLDDLPPEHAAELATAWNAWLRGTYRDQAALVRAWRARELPPGPELLANGDFSAGAGAGWNVENHGAARSVNEVVGEGPDGTPALRLAVRRASSAAWHVQVNQGRLALEAGTPYTLSFYARADAERGIDVSVGMAHDPWQNLGFQAALTLGREWKKYEFAGLLLNQGDANARLNFSGMGRALQTVWIARVSLTRGGAVGLERGELLDAGNIGLFRFRGSAGRTPEALRDWYAFLLDLEARYWRGMNAFLKNDLGVKSLVIGTIVGTSTPSLQALLDAVDTHAYWTHPVFPGRPWDMRDWYVRNAAMVNEPLSSTLAGLFVKRVQGKPHLLTEYNHGFPNLYEAEAFPLVALYAGLQDWDVIVPFAYSHRGDDWDTRRADNFFDIDQNPLKLASFTAAALSFRRGDVRPAEKELLAPLDAGREAALLPAAHAWRLVDAASVGIDPAAGFVHRVGLDLSEKKPPAGVMPAVDRTRPLLASDSGELVWDCAAPGAGLVTADTSRTKMAIGFSGGRRVALGRFAIETRATALSGFAVVALSLREGESFDRARRILLTALGAQENTGAVWYRYPDSRTGFPPPAGENITTRGNHGRAPSRVEGVRADIVLPYAPAQVKVWALDATGKRTAAVPVTAGGPGARLAIGPEYKALWYEIEVDH